MSAAAENATAAAPAIADPAGTAKDAAVEVGRVFGEGGTDGLILYALILATFLMFLALVTITILAFRSLNKKDSSCTEQSAAFAEASATAGEGLLELSTAISAKSATDAAHQLNTAATLARVETLLARVEARYDG